jgi:hypothetical protein
MALSIKDFIAGLHYGEAQYHENITIYPLFIDLKKEEAVPYLLLEEALKSGVLTVSEVNQEGSVNSINVTNNGQIPVLILDGEELLGAKQNRMVNATIVIPPHMRIQVPVSCVERGRWRYDKPDFDQAGVFGYSSIRSQKSAQIAFSLKRRKTFEADQGAIWNEIDRKQESMGFKSDTDALHEVYKDREEDMEKFASQLKPLAKQVGIAVFINNRFTCMDLFSFPETLQFMWEKLIKSYAMEALEVKDKRKSDRKPDMDILLNALKEAEAVPYPSVGMGTDIRIEGKGIIGAGLVVEEKVLHLSVFKSRGTGTRVPISGPSSRRRVYE